MKEFTTSGFFVLRTPLLPIGDFLALSQGLPFSQALREGGDFAAAAASDRKLLRTRFQQLADRAEAKEPLWLASPDFFSTLSPWGPAPEGEKGHEAEQPPC